MSKTMIVASGGSDAFSLRVPCSYCLIFLFVIVIAMLKPASNAQAQDTSANAQAGMSYGLFAQFHILNHSANFNEIPGFPKAPALFDGGDGSGLSFGALLGIPSALFFGDAAFFQQLHLEMRAGLAIEDATLETNEPTFVILRSGERVPGNFRHTIDASFQTLTLAPLLRYEVFNKFSILAGPQFGLNIAADFDQRQELTTPDEATLLSVQRDIDLYSGAISNPTSPALALRVGLAYEFDLNQSWSSALEASFRSGMGDIAENLEWQSGAVELGAVLRFTPPPSAPLLRDTTIRRDTVFRENPTISVVGTATLLERSVETERVTRAEQEAEFVTISERYLQYVPAALSDNEVGTAEQADVREPAARKIELALNMQLVMPDGTVQKRASTLADIEVEESISTRYTPLLNYVFFEAGSAELPPRYRQLTRGNRQGFNADSLYASSTLETYYHILNVIGSRLQSEKSTGIRLLGHADPATANLELARQRALTIRDYLMRVWDVDPARMKIETRLTPRRPSNENRPQGLAENRRVEIIAETPGLLEPLFSRNTVFRSDAESIQFLPALAGLDAAQQWRIVVRQGNFPLWDTLGRGLPPDRVRLALDEKLLARMRSEPLEYALEVRAGDGAEYRSPPRSRRLNISTRREQIADGQGVTVVERYSLLLFDFDDVSLSDENREILAFISSRLRPGTRVRIIGKTDAVGDPAYNRRLSARRAQSVAEALGVEDAQILGLGAQHDGLPNELPEGRFYNRTVVVEIENVRK